jgi:hypothetical protein
MMSNKNDGGPAFPFPVLHGSGAPTGMSLRDYFAGQVDVSMYTPFNNLKEIHGRNPTVGELAEYIAGIRMIEADAMLAARETV